MSPDKNAAPGAARHQFLTRWRTYCGLTLAQVCDRLRIPTSALHGWESGTLKVSDPTLARLAQIYGVPPEALQNAPPKKAAADAAGAMPTPSSPANDTVPRAAAAAPPAPMPAAPVSASGESSIADGTNVPAGLRPRRKSSNPLLVGLEKENETTLRLRAERLAAYAETLRAAMNRKAMDAEALAAAASVPVASIERALAAEAAPLGNAQWAIAEALELDAPEVTRLILTTYPAPPIKTRQRKK